MFVEINEMVPTALEQITECIWIAEGRMKGETPKFAQVHHELYFAAEREFVEKPYYTAPVRTGVPHIQIMNCKVYATKNIEKNKVQILTSEPLYE